MPSTIPGTAVIGVPVRNEIEITQGDTLIIRLPVPGGTFGKTFTSDFRHETYVSAFDPAVPVGTIAAGSFIVSTTLTEVVLTTPTGNLLPGRFVYDVRWAEPSLVAGQPDRVTTSRLREFIVQGGVTGGPGGGGASSVTQADVDASIGDHNTDPNAHGGLTGGGVADYEVTFVESDLSSGGVLIRTHGLPSRPSGVAVYDDQGIVVDPSWARITATTIEIDLADFQPLAGTWRLSAVK